MRTLTRAQLDEWATFGAEWGPFKDAWIERGFLLPPSGTAHDDDDQPSQRSMLWQIANDRPTDLGRWVREAPGRTTRDVIGYVLRQWQGQRGIASASEADQDELKRLARLEDGPVAARTLATIGDVIRGER